MAERIGQRLENYRLLGTGGFAEVYLGEHNISQEPGRYQSLWVARCRAGQLRSHRYRLYCAGLTGQGSPPERRRLAVGWHYIRRCKSRLD